MHQWRYLLFADTIFILHAIFFVYVLFGWILDVNIWIYIGILFLALIQDIVLGYCLLSKWEFDARKKVYPQIDYPYNFSSYYTDKLLGKYLSLRFIAFAIYSFLSLSIILNSYFALQADFL